MNFKIHTFFLRPNSTSLKEIQGEHLHNFKEILLMMFVCHKAAFTLEVRFSTLTYDARSMCFNFTLILMNINGSIDLQTVCRYELLRAFWSYTPHNVNKYSAFAKKTLKWRTMQCKTKTQYQEYIVYQGPLNKYFLQYWKQYQTKATVTNS